MIQLGLYQEILQLQPEFFLNFTVRGIMIFGYQRCFFLALWAFILYDDCSKSLPSRECPIWKFGSHTKVLVILCRFCKTSCFFFSFLELFSHSFFDNKLVIEVTEKHGELQSTSVFLVCKFLLVIVPTMLCLVVKFHLT